MDKLIEETIKETIYEIVPKTSRVQDYGFIQQVDQCKYYFITTSLLWHKVRIIQTCNVIVDKNDPLYWVFNICGASYIKSILECFNVKSQTVGDQIYLIIFLYHSESEHLTKDGCNQKISEVKKQFEQQQITCRNHSLCNDFNSIYFKESYQRKEQIQKINTELCIENYKQEIISNLDLIQFEGFVSDRATIIHNGIEYEQVELTICFMTFYDIEKTKLVNSKGTDFNNCTTYVQTVQEKDLKSSTTNKVMYINSKIQRDDEGAIIQRQLIQIENRKFFEQLKNKQYKDIFIDHEYFYKSFWSKLSYLEGKDFKKDSPTLPFQPGSILRVDRGVYFHAAVFLKFDLLIHVKLHQKNSQGQIFKFDRFEKFIEECKEIEEIRFDLNLFTPDEIVERAVEMNLSHYNYELDEQNCEHFAFELVSDIKFSPQMFIPWKKEISKCMKSTSKSS